MIFVLHFQTNTNIEILNLEGNGIDAQGAKCLCRVLRENLFLTEVVRTKTISEKNVLSTFFIPSASYKTIDF